MEQIIFKMSNVQNSTSTMIESSELSDNSEDNTVTVDKRTVWFMVAVVLVCMSLLAICVALVLWKKVFYYFTPNLTNVDVPSTHMMCKV